MKKGHISKPAADLAVPCMSSLCQQGLAASAKSQPEGATVFTGSVLRSDSSMCLQWNFNQNQLILLFPLQSECGASHLSTPQQWSIWRARWGYSFLISHFLKKKKKKMLTVPPHNSSGIRTCQAASSVSRPAVLSVKVMAGHSASGLVQRDGWYL